MNPNYLHELIAAQRAADLHREAAHERLISAAIHTTNAATKHTTTPWLWQIYAPVLTRIGQRLQTWGTALIYTYGSKPQL
ncbi:MAG: hypothetical protein Fur005_05110 [Roseiflexaceae bacterium]